MYPPAPVPGHGQVRTTSAPRSTPDRDRCYGASMRESKVQFNVYLPAELVRRIKHRAIDEQESLSALVERVMTEYLEEEQQ